jgi:hypothetical protein
MQKVRCADGEAREQRIAERPRDRRQRGRLARGQAQHERRHAPPQRGDEPGEQPGDERHVQPGNAHEVRHPGAAEEPPLLRGDGALVADGERGEDARRRRRAEARGEALAHGFARAPDQVHWRMAGAEQARRRPLAHVAGRADPALEQPGLVVEAVRVEVPVRPAQPHREQPALARMHAGRQGRRRFLRDGLPVPGQEQPARELLAPGRGFHVELEAHAALGRRRQARHHADHLDVAPLQRRRQPVRHARVREQRRP